MFFLLYAGNIISRTRITEYGLYNLLGFSKKNLCCINFLETILLYIICIFIGLSTGLLFSNVFEMLLAKLCHYEYNFNFQINSNAILLLLFVFGIIFLLTFINNSIKIFSTKSINLIKTSQIGDKPSKCNYIIGIAGLLILIYNFYTAVNLLDNDIVDII